LRGAIVTGADFRKASLDRTNISGVDLSRARGLTQSQLDDACGDNATKAPSGLVIRACGGRRISVQIAAPPAPPAPPAAPRRLVSVD
ncbi:MAG: hypothetical protein B7Z13_07515, partial [Caulobacterales bacterium 32-67-6]